jgi:DNA-binding response OmpR family regulator
MNVLIVEDESKIGKSIEKNLYNLEEINIIKIAKNYDEAIEKIGEIDFDIFLIDIFLGDEEANGIELAKKIREKNKYVPIIIITSSKSINFLEIAFEAGVNDYIEKPFDIKELQIRVKRWGNFFQPEIFMETIKYKEISYKIQTNEFFINDKKIELTKKNKILFLLFIKKPEQLLTAEYIREKYWGDYANTRKSRNLRSSIQSLRNSLSKSCPDWIQTVRGEGYILKK